jgi:hypothetical protein
VGVCCLILYPGSLRNKRVWGLYKKIHIKNTGQRDRFRWYIYFILSLLCLHHPPVFDDCPVTYLKTEKPPNLLWYKDLGYICTQKFDVSPYVPILYDEFFIILGVHSERLKNFLDVNPCGIMT